MCWSVETPYHIKNPKIGMLRDVGTPLPPWKSWNRNDSGGVCWAPSSHVSSEGGHNWVLGPSASCPMVELWVELVSNKMEFLKENVQFLGMGHSSIPWLHCHFWVLRCTMSESVATVDCGCLIVSNKMELKKKKTYKFGEWAPWPIPWSRRHSQVLLTVPIALCLLLPPLTVVASWHCDGVVGGEERDWWSWSMESLEADRPWIHSLGFASYGTGTGPHIWREYKNNFHKWNSQSGKWVIT